VKTLRGTPKHLSVTGELQHFTYLMLTLPFKCNYRCPKCFNLNDNKPITTGQEITLNEIFEKIREAKDLRAKVVVIAGEGEPTLDDDIRVIVSAINGLGMIPIIYSNGSSLTPDIAKFYHDHNVCLVIALDSLKPDIHRLLSGTRTNMLPLVLNNLDHLRGLYANTVEVIDGTRILRLALNMTLCSRNQNEIEAIKAFASDDMYFVCNPLARHGNAEGNWSVLIDSEEDFVEQQRLVRQHSESGGPLTLDKVGLCGYSMNGIGIGPYGHYMTCAYTSKTNGLLGTIRDRSLRDAYNFKTGLEREHYSNFGKAPCLVRAASFTQFLGSLESK
jgi:MoaA/NifB/PqqE/SkfB family radical SAM enzyme